MKMTPLQVLLLLFLAGSGLVRATNTPNFKQFCPGLPGTGYVGFDGPFPTSHQPAHFNFSLRSNDLADHCQSLVNTPDLPVVFTVNETAIYAVNFESVGLSSGRLQVSSCEAQLPRISGCIAKAGPPIEIVLHKNTYYLAIVSALLVDDGVFQLNLTNIGSNDKFNSGIAGGVAAAGLILGLFIVGLFGHGNEVILVMAGVLAGIALSLIVFGAVFLYGAAPALGAILLYVGILCSCAFASATSYAGFRVFTDTILVYDVAAESVTKVRMWTVRLTRQAIIVSWRWDIAMGQGYKDSATFKACVERTKELGYRYLLIDVICLDQKSVDAEEVKRFVELYRALPVLIAVSSSDEWSQYSSRFWTNAEVRQYAGSWKVKYFISKDETGALRKALKARTMIVRRWTIRRFAESTEIASTFNADRVRVYLLSLPFGKKLFRATINALNRLTATGDLSMESVAECLAYVSDVERLLMNRIYAIQPASWFIAMLYPPLPMLSLSTTAKVYNFMLIPICYGLVALTGVLFHLGVRERNMTYTYAGAAMVPTLCFGLLFSRLFLAYLLVKRAEGKYAESSRTTLLATKATDDWTA